MNLTYLKDNQRKSLLELLQKYEIMLDGTLGWYTGSYYTIELKEDAKPYHAKSFPIPKIHEQTLTKEVNRLIKIGVIKNMINYPWAAPTFITPNINGTVRFIPDFRELNKRKKKKLFWSLNTQDLLLILERFNSTTSLDLTMGYYHITLYPGF